MAKTKTAPQPVIAAAVVTAVQHHTPLAKAIDAAMSQAVLDATAEGISVENSEEIKRRIDAARERVIAEFKAAEAKATAEAKAEAPETGS